MYSLFRHLKSLLALLSAVAVCSCSTDHLISDPSVRNTVQKKLAEKKALLPSSDVWQTLSADMTPMEKESMQFLYANMSIADIGDYDGAFFLENVKYALKAKKEMPWGRDIPEVEFRHFVLPPRVNNETLDHFRSTYYDELKTRVEGMSLYDAALEVNHWCHEKATYSSTDGRTLGPMSTIQTAQGRCGEESVLTVAALRTVGIPARQVYTPLWAHTDSNHAWVEVWVDGEWHFMGACEPAPVLDYAWFNSTASRAIMLHTYAFGDYKGSENVVQRSNCFTELNVTDNYVPTRNSTVTVLDMDGKPVEGATVDYKVFNGGRFGDIASLKTDKNGQTSLLTGLGDLLVWAHHDGRFGIGKCESEMTTVSLEHKDGDVFSLDYDIVPPPEGMIPYEVTDEQEAENNARLQQEDRMRNSYIATFYSAQGRNQREDRLLTAARGNWKAVQAFIENNRETRLEDALALLESLTQKDIAEQPLSTLQSVLDETPRIDGMDYALWRSSILPPKTGNEYLVPCRKMIREEWGAVSGGLDPARIADDPETLVKWVSDNIKCLDEYNPQGLNMTPAGVWRLKAGDSAGRARLFITMCRAFGIPASQRGGIQYWKDGKWYEVDFGNGRAEEARYEMGNLKLVVSDADRKSRLRISPGLIENGAPSRSRGFFPRGGSQGNPDVLSLPTGYYQLTSGSRMARGNVLVHMDFFNVRRGADTTLPLTIPKARSEDVAVIGNIDTEINGKFLREGDREEGALIATTGRGYFVLMISGAHDEPTMHILNEMPGTSASTLNSWGRPFIVLTRNAHDLADLDKSKLEPIHGITYGIDTDDTVLNMVLQAAQSDRKTLPVFIIADSFGRVVYFSQGYNTSLGDQINEVISKIR